MMYALRYVVADEYGQCSFRTGTVREAEGVTERRLVINAEPLKFVSARAGEPLPEVMMLAVKRGKSPSDQDGILAVAVHRNECPDVQSGDGWSFIVASPEQVEIVTAVCDRAGVPVAAKCPGCNA